MQPSFIANNYFIYKASAGAKVPMIDVQYTIKFSARTESDFPSSH